ncbi:unnamed protein product [Kluyveromyces dobzhanskii CBS 2104]|uniref:WGS project CCBQ000000000 data, contig 00102 n=1 Tax=Kluyveromyces dobzhanskii CBS 2104 TaxID=1427455 RepID=A0A0A8L4E5_9SACH|nr:unnamed protein product [Kluyveromyces dobzhanskii CBS 2104]
MCGILAHFGSPAVADTIDEYREFDENDLKQPIETHDNNNLFRELIPYIVRRGPNYASLRSLSEINASFFSSVLSLRSPFTKQSVIVEDRYVLQYNGELYNDGTVQDCKHSDTEYIISLLQGNASIKDVVRKCCGEFAYVITDLQEKKVFFGRDSIGKRSLSYRLLEDDLFITSTSGRCKGFLNCLAGVIYSFDLVNKKLTDTIKIHDSPFAVSEQIDNDFSQLHQYKEKLYEIFSDSVHKRLTTIHPMHVENNNISVLFSGGLDCSVIAALLCKQLVNDNKYSETVVELLNVGFENPRTGKMPSDSPDRILALKSADLLRQLFPQVKIKLVEVDVSYDEYLLHKDTVVDLIYPKNTEMDLSIAIAFYFAARGKGKVTENGKTTSYTRSGVVLFSGLGADELYGGYHKFSNISNEELVIELQRQINQIHDRNLNRDDKVIANHGVEVRYPFLSEDVVQFSVNLPLNYKTNKLILRAVSKDILGLDFISEEPKRAIQFGARSAKMTKDSNKKGTDLLK